MATNVAVKISEENGDLIADALKRRADIATLEGALAKVPGAVFGDSDLMPLKHTFAEGVYVREIFIPKGCVLTGKIHKHSHPNFLMRGEVVVVTENGGREHLKAPLSMISAPGTKRAIVALEDTVWITVHVTEETDLEKIEEYVIAKDYDDPVLIANKLKNRNCLMIALQRKGREIKGLETLTPTDHLLPFKQSLEKLKQDGVSLDGLFAIKVKDGEWHVTTDAGTPLTDVEPTDADMVGTWVAVGVGGGTAVAGIAGSLISNKKKQSQVPLETPEQAAARRALLEFSRTGKWGDFQAGDEVGLGYGDYGITDPEQAGLSSLQKLLASGMPQQYQMGDAALSDLLATSDAQIQKQFDPFNTLVDRSTRESTDAYKRAAGYGGSLYSSSAMRGLEEIQSKAGETKTMQLANLTNDALNRRLQAIPLAYESGRDQENIGMNRIAASQQYGGLTRQLNDASIKARDAEILRRRQELQIPIGAAQTVAGQGSTFGIPSVSQASPYQDVLNLIAQIGGGIVANKFGNTPQTSGTPRYGQPTPFSSSSNPYLR